MRERGALVPLMLSLAAAVCYLWTLTDCKFYGRNKQPRDGLFIYDGWLVNRCKAYVTGDVTIRGRGAMLRQFATDGLVAVEANYQGAPAGAGTGVTIDQSTANLLWLKPGTSGSVTASVIERTSNETTAGSWTIEAAT